MVAIMAAVIVPAVIAVPAVVLVIAIFIFVSVAAPAEKRPRMTIVIAGKGRR
jgi:hypothetical protein